MTKEKGTAVMAIPKPGSPAAKSCFRLMMEAVEGVIPAEKIVREVRIALRTQSWHTVPLEFIPSEEKIVQVVKGKIEHRINLNLDSQRAHGTIHEPKTPRMEPVGQQNYRIQPPSRRWIECSAPKEDDK